MRKPKFNSLDEIADASAGNLAQAAAGWAFNLFRDRQFVRLSALESLEQVEQDRIFNELVLAALILLRLLLEAPDLRLPKDMQGYLAELSKRTPKAYVDQLRDLGIEAEYLRDWDKLIEMRYREYERDRHEVRATSIHIESAEKPVDLDGLSKIQLFVPLEAVAIGAHHHICRGETDGRDDLFRLLLKSLGGFYVELRVNLEGGKITPLTRARIAVKRTLRRIRGKS